MTSERTTIAIGAVCALAVVAGLFLVGGPGHARKQKRDAQREQDLVAMASWIDCLAQGRGGLPSAPAPLEQCPWDQRIADPYSQRAYRYEVTGPQTFRICAEFELPPQRPVDRWGRNPDGCVIREFRPPREERTPG